MRIKNKILSGILCLPIFLICCTSLNPYNDVDKNPVHEESVSNISGAVLEGNRIEVRSNVSGMYALKYEGADGQVLPDYASICTLTMNGMSYYDDFIDVNIAPKDVCAIGVYDYFEGDRQGGIALGGLKPDFIGTPIQRDRLTITPHIITGKPPPTP